MNRAPLPLLDLLRTRSRHIPATTTLITVNLLVFAAMLTQGGGFWHTQNGVQLAWGANFAPATQDGQWWRLASALFLHFGLLHLGMNMLSLWDGGRLVERMYGPARFLALYLASGLAGNLLSLVVQGNRAVSGGASGAIFGVYGALLVFLWLERRHLDPTEFRRLFWGAALFSAFAVSLGFWIPGIDNAAHVGGLVAGCLTGALLAPSLAPSPRPHAGGRWPAAAILAVGVATLLLRLPEPAYRWSEEQQARGEISAFLREDARISAHWEQILGQARREGSTFDQVAGRIESEVASEYAQSFEELSRLHLSPAAPSARALQAVRQYAELRLDASRALAEGLREQDPDRIRQALEMARHPPDMAADSGRPRQPVTATP